MEKIEITPKDNSAFVVLAQKINEIVDNINKYSSDGICDHEFYQPNSTSVCQQCKKCGAIKYGKIKP